MAQDAGAVDALDDNSRLKGTSEARGSSDPSATLPAESTAAITMSDAVVDPAPDASGSRVMSPQPMSKSNSSDSNTAAKDAVPAGIGGASPYGTRSRNRTGTSRPNYAEDKDIEMDFDAFHDRKEADARKVTGRTTSPAAGDASLPSDAPPRASNGNARKPLPTAEPAKLSAAIQQRQSHAKEQQSAAAATSATVNNGNANGTVPVSKKRKAAQLSSSTRNGVQSGSAAPSQPSAASQRRNGTAPLRPRGYQETNMLSFENCGSMPTQDGIMVADDGTELAPNDNVYLVCEPPGEPYYLGRIMEFLHKGGDAQKPVDSLRINWFYRPKDISRSVQDTRLLFATMHSDTCPLTSLRGKCQIKHKSEIASIAEYKRYPDCFWYEKLYDRYIQKTYEIIPTSQILNVPDLVKEVLDERWKFVLVEPSRVKELTTEAKRCKRCGLYCANLDSVDCASCGSTYHLWCVRPKLPKKPSRGFGWSCAPCNLSHEKKLEARNTPSILEPNAETEEEYNEEEEEEAVGVNTGRTTPSGVDGASRQPPTPEQIYHASLWPYRYLGMHCKPEDALDYDDRIYPRASSRMGPRHQANVLQWFGRPVQLVKPPPELKKSTRKDGKLSKDQQAIHEKYKAEKEARPKWIQDEPKGYLARGEDLDNNDPNNTAKLLWKPVAEAGVQLSDKAVDDYLDTARSEAHALGLPARSTNLEDAAVELLCRNNYDTEKAMDALIHLDKEAFKEPDLTPAEQKKFDEAVAKHGSELNGVRKHVKTLTHGQVVRYYYTWKKTGRGKQIWGNFPGRKGKKEAKRAEATATRLQDDVADDHDDSAFDTGKAIEKKRSFVCKFCLTKTSRQWRRAPNMAPRQVLEPGSKMNGKDKSPQAVQALCRRCAELWRRYAIQWEDMDEIAKKVAQTGGRSWRRRVDEELIKELMAADEMMSNTHYSTPDPFFAITDTSAEVPPSGPEPARKKLKGVVDKDGDSAMVDVGKKKLEKAVEKVLAAPVVPEVPKPMLLPCAICHQGAGDGNEADPHLTMLTCRECRLTVHKHCYGVADNRPLGKWTCDMCMNDKDPRVSLDYKCVLCPVAFTNRFVVDVPKPTSHKKKTEKDKEREKKLLDEAFDAIEYYRKRQEEMNKPLDPREPLKKTADNNWVHVTCAMWTPEVKFGSAKALSPSEGIPAIPRARYAETCKACGKTGGACVACHHCRAPVHVECANQANYLLGFEVTLVKSSRRDQFSIVTVNGETGILSAGIWCPEHLPTKGTVYDSSYWVEEFGSPALQVYAQNYKQADLTLTGCARKANQISLASRMTTAIPSAAHIRRTSTTTLPTNGPSILNSVEGDDHHERTNGDQSGAKVCLTCGTDISPRWYAIDKVQEKNLVNGHYGNLGEEALRFIEQRHYQCHKCKKSNRQQPKAPTPPRVPSPEPARPPPLAAMANGINGASPAARPVEVNGHGPAVRAPYVWTPPPGPPAALPVQGPLAGPSGIVPPTIGGPIAPVPTPQHSFGPAPPVNGPPSSHHPPAPGGGHSPHPLPMVQSGVAPPPLPHNVVSRPPPPPLPSQAPPYPPVNGQYDDWHRPRSQHGHGPAPPPAPPPPYTLHSHGQINGAGGPPPPPPPPSHHALQPPNHLRPPPLAGLSHPHIGHPSQAQPPPMQNGHMVQPPLVNGLPPSPRGLSGPHQPHPQMPNGVPPPYMNGYHHTQSHGPPPPHHHGPPAVPSQHGPLHAGPQPQPRPHDAAYGHLQQRSPYGHTHASPPVSRDGSLAGHPPRDAPPRDTRPSGGASSSPSLRNLLS